MLADIVVSVHLLIILFIVVGLPTVYLGAALRWGWVRNWREITPEKNCIINR
jgi:hypothetical protein